MDIWDAAAVGDGYRLSLTAAEYGSGGVFEEVTQWLDARMAADDAEGFFKPYDRDRGGIAPEPWHISFRPVAEQYANRVSLEWLMPLWSGSPDAQGTVHQPLAMLSVLAPVAATVLARYVYSD
jgi:LAS superfamily LD-carboxypeptidase LdcB